MNMKKQIFSNFPLGNKAIIFLALLVILSSFVSAAIYDDDTRLINLFRFEEASGKFLDTVDSSRAMIAKDSDIKYQIPALSPVGSYAINVTGTSWLWGNGSGEYMFPNPVSGNFTVACWIKIVSVAGSGNTHPISNYVGTGWYVNRHTESDANNKFNYRSSGEETLALYEQNTTYGSTELLGGWFDCSNICGILNDSFVGCDGHTDGLTNGASPFTIGSEDNSSGGNSHVIYVDDCFAFNTSLTQAELTDIWTNGIQEDTIPPILSGYNCTSCNVPNGDTTEPYETSDTTPTFTFNTSENAWCAIGVSDVNYTTMGASRNCNGGEGTQDHTCTLTTQDRFTSVGENILHISCKDSKGNEGNVSDSSKSNSGPIRIEIQGAEETGGDDAIQTGIEASEIWPCTVYSDNQIYARDLSNNQFTGTFDRVAIKDDKRWAFNYVSDGESPITELFNLTPVLYVLQLQNATNETITDNVGKLINDTY